MTEKRPTLSLKHDPSRPARPITAAKTIAKSTPKHAWAEAALKEALAAAKEATPA